MSADCREPARRGRGKEEEGHRRVRGRRNEPHEG